MGVKKTTQQNQNTFGFIPHQGTADEDAYRQSSNADFHSGIVSAYGQAENELNDTTFEEALPDGVKERIKYGRMFDLKQRKGSDLANAYSQEAQFKSGVLGNLAGLTQNKFVQTGGSSVGTQNTFGPALAGSFGAALGGA